MSNHSHQGHDHGHGAMQFNNAFLIAITANGLFVILQFVFSFISNSTSLMADAFHNLGDVLGLILAWTGMSLIKRKPTEKTTFGLKKTSILAALANALLLVFSCGIIFTDAVYKLIFPEQIEAISVMVVAAVGIIVNGATAALFLKGSDDLNIRGAFLHLFYDAVISLSVVVAAGILYWTGWLWVDPAMAMIIAVVILKGTWSLFKHSFMLIIDGVPLTISWLEVSEFLLAKPGVEGLHDLHIWALSTQENALSVHLYMPNEILTDSARIELVAELEEQFGIQHVTIQIEQTKTDCRDTCEVML